MNQWLNQHRQALQLVMSRMRANLLATFMMACVMGVTLCLPAILYVIVDNLNRLAGETRTEAKISLFLKLDANRETMAVIEQNLAQHKGIRQYQFVSKDQAWQDMQSKSGVADIASQLDRNPLPDAYFVEPLATDPASIDLLQAEMQQWAGVELAQVDASWIKRLYILLELGKKAILVLVALLGFALLAIIGNTIRLQIATQIEEIEVSKLIGATDDFIRRPFLYAGALYGLAGGAAAWLILSGVISLFNYSVAELAALYASGFRLDPPDWHTSLAMLSGAIALGWLGSYIAVNRSLSQFNAH